MANDTEVTMIALMSTAAEDLAEMVLGEFDDAGVPHKLQIAGFCYGIALLLNESGDAEEVEAVPQLIKMFKQMDADIGDEMRALRA